ncbi:PIN domain-containing protein [Halalkalicoccus ordinarius]|uniref:PIN domain-containing protein n=1 Tax=Halalkalicoccus ordinarius TaxID=3116651 RepID=UPI00300F3658
MKVLETSFLVDYLNEQSYTLDYLNANAEAEYAVPTIALYELYAGAIRSDATSETITTVAEALQWASVVAFNDSATREAARIRATLLDQGQPIPVPDMLNASIARAVSGELIATDEHFAQIPDFDFYNPRSI